MKIIQIKIDAEPKQTSKKSYNQFVGLVIVFKCMQFWHAHFYWKSEEEYFLASNTSVTSLIQTDRALRKKHHTLNNAEAVIRFVLCMSTTNKPKYATD